MLLILCVSFCSFGTQFIFQALFLMELNAYHMRYSNTFLFQVYLSGNFNIVIFMYMVTTTIYSLGGIFENWSIAMNFVNFPLVFDLIELFFRYGVWCYFLFHLRYHTVSLTSRHTNESVIKQKTYGKTSLCSKL